MAQTFMIFTMILSVLLFGALCVIFLISRKSQMVMESLLEILTHPEQVKVQNAARVLQNVLKDEIEKIGNNFNALSDALNKQIEYAEKVKQELTMENERLVSVADDATKKVVNMSQRLDNTVDGLQTIVNSGAWLDVNAVATNFCSNVEEFLNRLKNLVVETTEHSTKIQDQISETIESEKIISEQLSQTFANSTESMTTMTEATKNLQQQVSDLQTSVNDGFINIKNSSVDYEDVLRKNDTLIDSYFTKMAKFTSKTTKDLQNHHSTIITNTSNIEGRTITLLSSLNRYIKALVVINQKVEEGTRISKDTIKDLNDLGGNFRKEIGEFSAETVKQLKDVYNVANGTLENTRKTASDFAESINGMGVGVNNALTAMSKAHSELSEQSSNLINMSTSTTEQLKPLSALIERYYSALPDLAKGSHEMADDLENIVNSLVEKVDLMKNTMTESLGNIDSSAKKLTDLTGESRQQMIDLMSDYTKAVDAMQSLNKQMMVARASAPMDAIKVAPEKSYKPVSSQDFIRQLDGLFEALYEQAVDLTRSLDQNIPDVVWQRYNDGETKIFAKWLVKVFGAIDKKRLRELLKSDKVLKSQTSQFVRSFDKILNSAEQTNDFVTIKDTILKNDLGIIYKTLKSVE